ncbi:type II RES/Xre toxin-antitoxin system antitoxin [Humisphaera borealis]|uniref:DUF2384 domain-containing protein n=1 Tax=Humisphaera borealis TaxID=2807512 RepID=A0A7M2WWW6_9BACT|nr:antitoxin Xre/MbcA/ParS toxin-binding domain-containing protein [Humisphaera borealis]QOV89889.1 DUF2384 domain-containing protein [Humisphaera borealis]
MAKKTQTIHKLSKFKPGATTGAKNYSGIYTAKMALRGPLELVKIVQTGVPVSDAKKLYSHYKVDEKEVIGYLKVSVAKFKKWKANHRLSSEESDRLVRLARLMAAADALHEGDAEAARRWMESPKSALGGSSPLKFAQTEVGAREVEHLIGRLEHGVFS